MFEALFEAMIEPCLKKVLGLYFSKKMSGFQGGFKKVVILIEIFVF
jgi:hypothetical protein